MSESTLHLPRLRWLVAANILVVLALYLIFTSSVSAEVRGCSATHASTDGKRYVWLIHLTEGHHTFLITQPKGNLDNVLSTCKKFLKEKQKRGHH